jgi:hypothetical protein
MPSALAVAGIQRIEWMDGEVRETGAANLAVLEQSHKKEGLLAESLS